MYRKRECPAHFIMGVTKTLKSKANIGDVTHIVATAIQYHSFKNYLDCRFLIHLKKLTRILIWDCLNISATEKDLTYQDNRISERKNENQEVEDVKNIYWDIFGEWVRLDRNKTLYAPKTPDEEWHPLFVEALQKLAYQEYLLDCAESEVYEIEHRNNSGGHS